MTLSTPVSLLRTAHAGPAAAVTVLTLLIAVGMDADAGTVVVLGIAVLSGQLVVGWTNDLLDRTRDRMAGRTDKPLVTGCISVTAVRRAACVSSAICVVASALCGPAAGLLHLALVGVALAYNAWLKSTVSSWLPYALAFGGLPVVVSLSLDSASIPPLWMAVAGALFGIAAHLHNALPDLTEDAATGVRGLPHRLGARNIRIFAALTLVAASTTVFLGTATPPLARHWLLMGAVLILSVVTVRSANRTPFYAAIAIAGVNVVMLLLR
ncbi:UbiA family prenyltransferase [Rhodococcus tibetensis]|uniref:UbiA family prenyltransferase n=1 Tax=Rhodococcus tibetensis TaxID=2965064 RepID=A0ABT1QC31_9NOCA|nr:UbiA family prenyltransferase [Rhodococcus sp. FXJ9.536]MCQ4118660.1 UbiA family prenyltransferase [Rhodococcus sp. FXJ9.536]